MTAVIFDLDGVVTDTATIHERAWKSLFDDFLATRPAAAGEDHRAFSDDDYRRFVDGKARHDGVASFLRSRGISLEPGRPDDDQELSDRPRVGERQEPAIPRHAGRRRRAGLRQPPSSSSGRCGDEVSPPRWCRRARTAPRCSRRPAWPRCSTSGWTDWMPSPSGCPASPTRHCSWRPLAGWSVEPGRAAVVEDALAGVEAGRTGNFGVVIGVDRARDGVELLRSGADVVVAELGRAGRRCRQLTRATDVGCTLGRHE